MNNNRTVIINGKFLQQKITGVQRFAWEVLKELDNFVTTDISVILAVSPFTPLDKYPLLKNIKIKKVGFGKGILWEQISLAFYIRKTRGLGLHFCNAVPLLSPRGIVTVHDISNKINKKYFSSLKHKMMRLWHLLQLRTSIKKTLAVLTVSEFSKEQICNTYRIPHNKVSVVYSGWQHFDNSKSKLNLKQAFPILKPKEFYFSMATLAKNKNFEWIINAAKNNLSCVFAIAGMSDLKEKMYSITNGENLSNVHFLGYVTDEEAKLLLQECKAFIFPSLYEGFGLPPMEALAMGSPIICSTSASLPEIYKKSAHYIDPLNADVNLDSLLSEPVEPAKNILDLYSWKKTAKKIWEVVYEHCN